MRGVWGNTVGGGEGICLKTFIKIFLIIFCDGKNLYGFVYVMDDV